MSHRDFSDAEDQAYRELGERLASVPWMVETLPDPEQRVAQRVVEGAQPYEIAMEEGISEEAVWTIVRSLANAVAAPAEPIRTRGYETAGIGSDTDPGVTGGYGDTGFGSIGNEPPIPVPEEPEEETSG